MDAFLPRLPAELLLIISGFLDYECEINNLSRVNHKLYALLDPYLYQVNFHAEVRHSQPLIRSATHGIETTARKAIAAGAKPGGLHLTIAAYNGLNDLITLFHEQGANINCYIGVGNGTVLARRGPPFYRLPEAPTAAAATCGHESIALTHAGAAIRARDSTGSTPLYLAALGGHMDVIQFLVEKGPSHGPYMRSKSFCVRSPLTAAVTSRHVEIVQYLIDYGATISEAMFLIAGSTGKPEVLKILARHSKYPEAAKNAADQAIFAVAAAACGLGDLLTRSISLGWDVNQVIMDGTELSALGWAAAHGHLEIVCMLLSHGAHPDGKQGLDNSVANPAHPLLGAVKRGHEEIVSLLLENGSNVNVRDDNSEIMFYAITNPRIFRMLLEKGAMPNGFKGCTLKNLAGRAVKAGQAAEVQMLTEMGVDFSVRGSRSAAPPFL